MIAAHDVDVPDTATPDASAASGTPGTPGTLAEFLTLALQMENEAAARYTELADAMEMHNNREVMELFRRMAMIESLHAKKIIEQLVASGAPLQPALSGPEFDWKRAGVPGGEAPEATPGDQVHYLMQPYHALQLALANEVRAEQFFDRLARLATIDSVRDAAIELRDEEREHVVLVKLWMGKVPKPADDWADDPDPPRYTD
jgi:rubrerythrin